VDFSRPGVFALLARIVVLSERCSSQRQARSVGPEGDVRDTVAWSAGALRRRRAGALGLETSGGLTMKHLVLDVILLGCIGAVCAPVGCSSPPDAPSSPAVRAGDDGEQVGEAQEEAQSCTHDTCTTGAPLSKSCSTCTANVCNFGAAYCCQLTWDDACVKLAAGLCGTQGLETCSCTHDTCTVGAGLDSGCSACTARVCDSRSSCCGPTGTWDANCVGLAEMFCGVTCAPPCAHDVCDTGVALSPSCSPCVQTLCANTFGTDKYCCGAHGGDWDRQCVNEVAACAGCGR
jgi:hypothetical protein